jgi:hypothetical protein
MSIVLGGYSLLYTRTMEKKETPVAAGCRGEDEAMNVD